jgi:hypothetical protein
MAQGGEARDLNLRQCNATMGLLFAL